MTAATTEFELEDLVFPLSWKIGNTPYNDGTLPNVEPTDASGAFKVIAADGKNLITVTNSNYESVGMDAAPVLYNDVVLSVGIPTIDDVAATPTQLAVYTGEYEVVITPTAKIKIGADWNAAKAVTNDPTVSTMHFYISISNQGVVTYITASHGDTQLGGDDNNEFPFTYGIIAQNQVAGEGGIYTPDSGSDYSSQSISVALAD